MTGTYYDRLTGPDKRTVEELCRPLSAKVMPRIAMIGITNEITEQQAIGIQRKSLSNPGKSQQGRKAKRRIAKP